MTIGIVQGRLSPPVNHEIQAFPTSTWESEFELIEQLPVMPYYSFDVDSLEWIVTSSGFARNPLFNTNLSKYPIHAVCADAIIDDQFPNLDFMEEMFVPICVHAVKNNIFNVTVPLLEKSSVMNDDVRKEIIPFFVDLVKNRIPNLCLSFEFEANQKVIDDVLSASKSFRMTYDTGNFTSYVGKSVDHNRLISDYFDRIDNIHLKDRSFSAQTVEPGEGDTDFVSIFETLADLKYGKQFTLQTARGVAGKEMITLSRHLDYFYKLMEITEPL